ncbi:hypothetical protein [Cytobacillus gottheilii]|uniref:hypothetical protein n=1 Tax=Cytobacillus gottheilii TaxID=859144 RepID=UPI001593A5A5|nr:hypothetical protein [Cytobacillus gottheilii]
MLDINLEGIVNTDVHANEEKAVNLSIGGEDLLQLLKDIHGEKVRITIEELK